MKKKGLYLTLILCMLLSSATPVYADKQETTKAETTKSDTTDELVDEEKETEVGEWTKEKKESVFTSYILSGWGDIEGFAFSENGSYSKSNIPDDFRKKWGDLVENALSNSEVSGMYGKKEYSELMLCILYQLKDYDKWYGENPADKFYYNHFISAFPVPASDYQSIQSIFKKFVESEKYYLSVEESRFISIYNPDNALLAVIQGMFYGHGYLDEYEEYNKKEATKYEKDHADSIYFYLTGNDKLFSGSAAFAESVSKLYKAVSAGEHKIIDQ